MNKVFGLLARNQSKLFTVSYAPEYKTFIPNHIISDHMHPLNETQKRRARDRKKEGLWWHTTTGVDASKSSCVRAWARRRLRPAVTEELRARGYDENGMLINAKNSQTKTTNLFGSLRLHILPALLPAKFTQVKQESGQVIDILLQSPKHDTVVRERMTSGRPQWNSHHQDRSRRMHTTQR
jgi:hypothetical protein